MKPFVIVLKICIIFVLFELEKVESENNRFWFEIDRDLYYVEPEARYTWKQAVSACKKVQSNLIQLKGDYNYAKLKAAIKRNFKNHSSLWTSAQVKSESFFHHFGLATEQHNRQKCYKFDNSSAFKALPENCGTRLGFICEKALLQTASIFYNKNIAYFVQPRQSFTCKQAYAQCEKRQMFLLPSEYKENSELLNNLLFINYGSNVNYWFSVTNETHYNCETMTRNPLVSNTSGLGFICQRTLIQKHILTNRHIVLLVFVVAAACLAISIFVLIKFFYLRRMQSLAVIEEDIRKENLVTDI